MSLKKEAISGFKWSSLSQLFKQGIQLLTLIILARLLSPSDFGILGIALVIIGFIAIFKDLGTSSAIVYKQDISNTLKSNIFYLNCIIGIIASLILFIIAPIISGVFAEPKLLSILRLLSFNFIISSPGLVYKAFLEKKLKFNQLAIIDMAAATISSFVGIGLAILGHGVWSLVWQILTTTIVTTVLYIFSDNWRPSLSFNFNEISSISKYSFSLTGYTLFNFFARNIDDFLIGKVLGTQALGYYTLAYRLMLSPIMSIASITHKVAFPILSKMQEDNRRFQFAYLRIVNIIATIIFPIILGILFIAEPLVVNIFGQKWEPAIPLLLIFTPVAICQSIGSTVGIIYQAKGKTDWLLKWGIFAGTMIIIAFFIGIRGDIKSVAFFYSATSCLILTYPNFAIPFRLIDLSVFSLIKNIWRPFITSILMLILISQIKILLPSYLPFWWNLAILIFGGTIFYLIASWFLNRRQLLAIINLVK